jgi:quinol monooxygenase YgiN
MVVEYIRYIVDEARADAFEKADRRAAGALESSEHCERFEVSRCTEDTTQHVVRIEWDSEDGHMSGFRQRPEFRAFFKAVGPFVHDIEEMRHYEVTLSSEG